jgi:hypothetical protein
LQNSSFKVNGRSMISLVRYPSMLEAGRCSTLFPCENCISMWNENLWSESILKWENHSLCEKYPHGRTGETHVSYGTIQYVRDRSVLHIVSLWELSYLLKGILPTSQNFQVWGTSPLCKIGPFMWMEEALFLL